MTRTPLTQIRPSSRAARLGTLAAIFLLPIVASGPVLADTALPSVTLEVRTTDLADPARHAEIVARIDAAALAVCRHEARGDLLRAFTLRQCHQAAKAQGMSQLDALMAEEDEDGAIATGRPDAAKAGPSSAGVETAAPVRAGWQGLRPPFAARTASGPATATPPAAPWQAVRGRRFTR